MSQYTAHIKLNLSALLETILPSSNRPERSSILLLTTAYDKILWGMKFLNGITAGYSALYVKSICRTYSLTFHLEIKLCLLGCGEVPRAGCCHLNRAYQAFVIFTFTVGTLQVALNSSDYAQH